ncbi:hypothetical protein LTR64_008132 [Lithohypha guttulata]|uniref:Zn(2)-C6 fungal-type domain-containing protein n=1 Tax=Lithohypha guttulata TaxID=1690604 RepID=A0AAN7T854_9EURO|nr:hypothetical protein LTR51_008284 [Lithohypha guttulata]KAK5091609.1 hypothetical protein LTR05_001794 [Lithohypha guttulata]
MNSQIHLDPSLRSNPLSSPARTTSQHYPDAVQQVYSPVQPSPNNSYQSIHTPNYYGNQPTHDSPDDHSPGAHPSAGQNPDDLKRPRACEACRQLKVKCEIDDNSPNGSCKRCAKAHRQCIITLPSRKRQKKTDSRVAELEKKIDALTATLAARGGAEDIALDPAIAQQQYQHQPPIYNNQWNGPVPPIPPSPSNPIQVAGIKRKSIDTFGPFGDELHRPQQAMKREPSIGPAHLAVGDARQSRAGSEPPSRDLVDRGLIDTKTAYRCFDRYHKDMSYRLPVVIFPSDTKAEDIRKIKPTLFHAIVAVASGTIRPDLQSKLISDATRILAERIVYTGEKSMELVQAIQIMTVFYQPPERYEELNFNQLIHIAAVMALDIGMGKRTRKSAPIIFKGFMERSKVLPDPNAAETRRCWLGCYYMCSNSAMSLRRPLLVRWSPYADECLEILRTAPDALPSDKWLCHIVKAQHIAEMIGTEFAMDDPAKEIRVTDLNVQFHLRGLEQELEKWHKEGEDFMTSPIMRHTKAIINLYMHEIAMHNEHNIDDFRPPYHSTPIEGPPDPDSVTPIHIDSLTKCLHSAHEAFDAFLSMDIDFLRSLPTHFFVRNSYAAVALIKLYTACAAKESKMGAIFQPAELKVDYYLDGLISTLMKVAEGGMSRVAYKFSIIFQMLRNWHLKRTEAPSGRGSREHSQPRMPPKAVAASRTPVYHPPLPRPNEPQQKNQSQAQIWPHQAQAHAQAPIHPSHSQSQSQPQGPSRNGLQMLSDAAMNPRPMPGPPTQQSPWLSSPQQQQQQQGMQQNQQPPQLPTNMSQQMSGDPNAGGVPMAIDPMMAAAYGMPPDQMSLLDFTSDELMAYGFGDEFLAMNFGFDQGGGWAI